jgi:ABC-2 type transport system ATP-binding protein
MSAILCENVIKMFGRGRPVRALDRLTLRVEEGEVFGLLGPNGSGKTTFVRCCLGIVFPTSGRLAVLGRRPGHPRTTGKTGYLQENPSFHDHLTGYSFLHYHAELARVPWRERDGRIREMLDLVRLDRSAARRRLRTYSKGMLQRIGLAQALVGKPKLVFLDEPQSGLDPIGRRLVKDIMRRVARNGTTVLFSSHVLSDVEDVADRVAMIDRGRVRRIASLGDFTLRTNRVQVRLRPEKPSSEGAPDEAILRELQAIVERVGGAGFSYEEGKLTCTVEKEEDVPRLVHELCSNGCEVYEVARERMTLEETFLQEFGELPPAVETAEDRGKKRSLQ